MADDLLTAMVMRHEGLRLRPYADAGGKQTIGWGRNLTDCGISLEEAHCLLAHDLEIAVRDLETFPWFADLTAPRQRALVDMRFNLGTAGFRGFTTMIHAVAVGQYLTAAQAMRVSLWARQVGRRADELATMVEHG